MTSLFEYLFGPLSKDWCVVFRISTIVIFCSFVFLASAYLYSLMAKNSRIHVSLWLVAYSFLSYIVARLYYTMCVRS